MGTFLLEAGEQVIDRVGITTTFDRRELPGELILTDRRVVLTVDHSPSGVVAWFGLLGYLVGMAMTKRVMSHQIRRAAFSDVELMGKDELKVRSKGEGYAVVWFEVRPVGGARVRSQKATEWSDQLQQWARWESAAQKHQAP